MSYHDDCSSSGEDSGLWNCEESLYGQPEFVTQGVKTEPDQVIVEVSPEIVIETSPCHQCPCFQDLSSGAPVGTLTSGLDFASPERKRYKNVCFGTPDGKQSRNKTRERQRTPRTLSRMMKRHRENERNRHQGLNYAIVRLSRKVPGHNENQRETKVVIMQRVIDYITFLENTVRNLGADVGFDASKYGLFLTSYLSEQEQDSSDIHPVVAEACQFLETIDIDKTLKNMNNHLLTQFRHSQQPSVKFGTTAKGSFTQRSLSESSCYDACSSQSLSDIETGISFSSPLCSTGESSSLGHASTESSRKVPSPKIVHCTVRTAPKVQVHNLPIAESSNCVDATLQSRYKTTDKKKRHARCASIGKRCEKQSSEEPPEKRKKLDSRIDLRKTSWMNGFMMFSRLNRRSYIKERPGIPTSSISKLMGQVWRSMSAEDQQPYKDKARLYAQYMLDAYNLPEDMQ